MIKNDQKERKLRKIQVSGKEFILSIILVEKIEMA
jgi:hypothetical protein